MDSVNYVIMKISPFEKATTSNIKDAFILVVSVRFFHDFVLRVNTVVGITLVFVGSVAYSLPFFKPREETERQEDYTLSDDEESFMNKLNDEIANIHPGFNSVTAD